jgi:radical SAM protein with 4Fe4S-binding SPASM domain
LLSVSNLLCNHNSGNERLRYGHQADTNTTPRPVVVWAVTRACNLRCVHCYASATRGPAEGELSREEGFALLDDLRQFDVPAVLFSGGEPLMRTDTPDFIKYATSIGLSSTLSTNGILIDDKMADDLATFGLKYAGISIDGTEAQHDTLRGQVGAFKGAMAGIRRCRERGIRVGVRFTVHALNQQHLDEIFDLCLENDVQRLCVYHLAYAGRGGKMQKVDLTADETRRVVDRVFELTAKCHEQNQPLEVLTVDNHTDAAYIVLQLEKTDPARAKEVRARLEGTGGNRSGEYISAIDPVGNVHYDQFSWHYNCGNVREQPFSTIWSDATDPRLAILRNRKPYLPERCRGCRFLNLCNGNLRTRAQAATGNWLGFDPSCYLTDDEIKPIRAD